MSGGFGARFDWFHLGGRDGNRRALLGSRAAPITGKKKQLWRSVKGPKREAEALLTQLLHERDSGIDRPVGKLTIADYLERWLRDYAEPSLAPKTVATYRDAIRLHFTPTIGKLELQALRPMHIQALYTDLGRKLSARSVMRYHQILHAALRQAVRWQLLTRNPADAVEPPRPHRRDMRVLALDEARAIMAAADATPYGAFVRLAFLTGARRGELLGLR
jgi:integrase